LKTPSLCLPFIRLLSHFWDSCWTCRRYPRLPRGGCKSAKLLHRRFQTMAPRPAANQTMMRRYKNCQIGKARIHGFHSAFDAPGNHVATTVHRTRGSADVRAERRPAATGSAESSGPAQPSPTASYRPSPRPPPALLSWPPRYPTTPTRSRPRGPSSCLLAP